MEYEIVSTLTHPYAIHMIAFSVGQSEKLIAYGAKRAWVAIPATWQSLASSRDHWLGTFGIMDFTHQMELLDFTHQMELLDFTHQMELHYNAWKSRRILFWYATCPDTFAPLPWSWLTDRQVLLQT